MSGRLRDVNVCSDVVAVCLRVHVHVAPRGHAPLVDAVREVDQLAVVVLQAAGAEGLVHALTPQGHGEALLQSYHAQQDELWSQAPSIIN